jgi:hypothetical protein
MRGVEHLKRSEYGQAVAAFTEAIHLDLGAPNAYAGRALAYRGLGDDAQAARDEQTVRELGGTERTPLERFVRGVLRRWKWDLGSPKWRASDPLSRKAVMLYLLNAQILNGGLHQWLANGYGEWVDEVAEAAREVGTDAAREVAAMLEDLSRGLKVGPAGDGRLEEAPQHGGRPAPRDVLADEQIGACEDRFYQVQSQFVHDLEEWLDARKGPLP